MSEYTPHRMLVTGGAGFIGSNFVRQQLESWPELKIVTLDCLTYAGVVENLEELPGGERHTFVKGDICDRPLVDRLLAEHEIDTIVHLAAESHVDRSIDGPAPFIQTNFVGTFTLLDAAKKRWLDELKLDEKGCRFHHVSTDEVYGSLTPDDPPFQETTPYDPSSPYSASKAGSDHLVAAYHRTFGLPATVTNCSNNYGPYQFPEKFIPVVIMACVNRKPIPVYGDGSNIRDWLYVRDHCLGIDAVFRRGQIGRTYNVGGRNEWANIDIAKLICRQVDEHRPGGAPHEDLIEFVKDRPGHDWRYAMDTRRIEAEVGFEPEETFETGIKKTVTWYLDRYSEG